MEKSEINSSFGDRALLGSIFVGGILMGIIIRSLFITADTRSVQESLRYKYVQVDSLEAVIQQYGATVQYVDLDQRLYTPYDGHTIVKHYENIVTQPYGDSTKFLIVHDIKISKLR